MNKFILTSAIFLLASSANAATEFSDISNCMADMGLESTGNEGNYAKIPVNVTMEGGKLLVVTGEGAILADVSRYDQLNAGTVYAPPGQAELIRDWFQEYRGKVTNGSTGYGRNGKDEPSQSTKLSAKLAAEAASQAMKRRLSELKADDPILKRLDSYVRDPSRSGEGPVNPQIVDRLKVQYEGLRAKLKYCDEVPNAGVRAAAVSERARLDKVEQKLSSYAPVKDALADCMKAQQRALNRPAPDNGNGARERNSGSYDAL